MVKHLQSTVSKHPQFDMVVRRSNVLTDALRRMEKSSFTPPKGVECICIIVMNYRMSWYIKCTCMLHFTSKQNLNIHCTCIHICSLIIIIIPAWVYYTQMQVVFVGEQGQDTGGLTREFFRLICYSMKSKYMEPTGCFRHNAVAYQV